MFSPLALQAPSIIVTQWNPAARSIDFYRNKSILYRNVLFAFVRFRVKVKSVQCKAPVGCSGSPSCEFAAMVMVKEAFAGTLPLAFNAAIVILVDHVRFDHDGRDTVALRLTERFDAGTRNSALPHGCNHSQTLICTPLHGC
ncbi:hypothetical protein KM043_009601 [Ampulex compressa]|nr:hypothetical protein KM043_009601 [Ampulex compressa]